MLVVDEQNNNTRTGSYQMWTWFSFAIL